MPRHPIYIPLLPVDAQEVIGQVHRNTRPAQAMLEREGFEYRDMVDIFDGGPTVHAETQNIRTVRDNVLAEVKSVVEEVRTEPRKIVSNCELGFRCCLAHVELDNRAATIDKGTSECLGVGVGDSIRVIDLRPS